LDPSRVRTFGPVVGFSQDLIDELQNAVSRDDDRDGVDAPDRPAVPVAGRLEARRR
jgi:hypothetical protein